MKELFELDAIERQSMACPALPLCGLAIGEAERTMPDVNRRIRALLDRLQFPPDFPIVVGAQTLKVFEQARLRIGMVAVVLGGARHAEPVLIDFQVCHVLCVAPTIRRLCGIDIDGSIGELACDRQPSWLTLHAMPQALMHPASLGAFALACCPRLQSWGRWLRCSEPNRRADTTSP